MERHQLLTTAELAVGYKGHRLFEGLNLGLSAGQLVCFMGPNGIGKSSLIRTLAGLQPAISGKVSYLSEGIPTGHAQRPAVVLTDRITAGYMTVRQLVTFGRYPHMTWNLTLTGADKDAIESALHQLGIQAIADRPLAELSDGQVQMAQIARAVAQDTSVILLDEPTAHLDLNNRVSITMYLRQLAHQSGRAVLMATHELDLALQTADLVWLAGKGIRSGVPEDLVLDGSFDEIFQFKGFDLRTGRVQHTSTRRLTIELSSVDHVGRWTRNALERNGYKVVATGGDRVVEISRNGPPTWRVGADTYTRLSTLLASLEKIR